jgi:Molybdopterin-binding domain of aldehyde dehydrogenase
MSWVCWNWLSTELDTARMRHALDLATSEAGWGRAMPEGHALGVAAHRSFLTYVAAVVEVAVGADRRLAVPRVWMAVDRGFAANPDRVRAQMEGAAIMGLGNAIGQVSFKNGRAEQSNFSDYHILPIGAARDRRADRRHRSAAGRRGRAWSAAHRAGLVQRHLHRDRQAPARAADRRDRVDVTGSAGSPPLPR